MARYVITRLLALARIAHPPSPPLSSLSTSVWYDGAGEVSQVVVTVLWRLPDGVISCGETRGSCRQSCP